jgi:predicted transcriptional regulator
MRSAVYPQHIDSMKTTASTAAAPMAANSITQPIIQDTQQNALGLSSPNIQIIRSPHKVNYSVIDNICIDDERLDPTALAILLKRLRNPNRRFVAAVVAKEMKKNIGTIQKYLSQLIDLGYLVKRTSKNARGQYTGNDYLLTEKATATYIDTNQFDVTSKVEEAL